jgi:lysophospholipase L1-like esterase
MRLRMLTLIAAVLALFVAGAVPASASSEGHGYLALGDSVPFGFNPLVSAANANNFVGYPEAAARLLNIEDVNATCPGEASGGFLSLTGTDNVCRPYRSAFPLHVAYSTAQIAFATSYLMAHRDTRLVTLTLGANDLFRWQKDCAAGPNVGTCPLGLGGVLAILRANLTTIFADIRATGYTGLIVGVTYYALNYNDPASVGGSEALNAQMAAAGAPFGVLIADGFAAWRPTAEALGGGDSCVAGLLIRTSPTGCDVHPTPAGRDLLAEAVVNTIAGSCPAASPTGCLMRNRG